MARCRKVTRETARAEAAGLLSAAYILVDLRVPKPQGRELFRGVRAMRESSTYQTILDEGREEGELRQARKMLLRQGGQKFGQPEPAIETAIQAITDRDRLEQMSVRLLTVTTWKDLLTTR